MTLQACANIVHAADTARWRAAMASPVDARDILLPIYAANVEISRAPWVTAEPMIAQMRLQWWHDALGEIGTDKVRRHEVVTPLNDVLTASGADALQKTVAARQWDVDKQPFETSFDAQNYAQDTTFGPLAAGYWALGGTDDADTRAELAGLAIGVGVSRFLQSYVDLKGSGARPFHDPVSKDDIANMADNALKAFGLGKKLLRYKAPETAALIECAGAQRFLKFIKRKPGSVLDGSIPSYALRSAIARGRVAWGLTPPSAAD